MRDPHELYDIHADLSADAIGADVMVLALGNLIDAGNVQQLLTQHLLGQFEHSVLASFDLDQLYDYRGRRPVMTFDRDHYQSYQAPRLVLYRLVDAAGTPFLLLAGPEPDYQWERFTVAVEQLVHRFGIRLVVGAHGVPMGVPHTRPVGVTRYASDPRLLRDNQPLFGMIQLPGSIEGLLHLRLAEKGHDTMGFALHVPHYLVQTDFADAAVAAVEAISAATGLVLPDAELRATAGLNRAEIERQVRENDEVGEFVSGLERQYDAFAEGLQRQNLLATQLDDLPSADEIGAELEEFLREETGD